MSSETPRTNAQSGTLYVLDTPETDAAARMWYGEKFYVDCAVSASLETRLKLAQAELSALKQRIEAAGKEIPKELTYGELMMLCEGHGTSLIYGRVKELRSHAEALAVQSEERRKALATLCVTMSELIQCAKQAEAERDAAREKTIDECARVVATELAKLGGRWSLDSAYLNQAITAIRALKAAGDPERKEQT